MKKIIKGVFAMGIISMLFGCAGIAPGSTNVSKEPITIDYAEYPDNFMIKLNADQEYILKNGDASVDFSATTHALTKSGKILKYGDLKADLANAVYYRKTEPVLIHYNDKDYIWICEDNGSMISGVSYFYLTQYNSFGSDNGSINLKFEDGEVLDPSDFTMNKSINCFGYVTAAVHYTINEQGKPAEIETDDEFYYIDSPYSEEVLCLDEDINTWIYADADADESTVEAVPAGTTFRRLRVPKNAEYSYVEGILDDGRIMRVVEEYWFSEPTAYQAMMDKDAKQFTYSVK